ncbi:MAG: META domain-containing protein [Pseudomonadota bacterium]
MKKFLLATTTSVMLFGLAACGGQQESEDSSTNTSGAQESTQGAAEPTPQKSEDASLALEIPEDQSPEAEKPHGLLGGERVVLWNSTDNSQTLEYLRPTDELLTRVWMLKAANEARIKLDNGVLAGVTGCNNFTGNYEYNDEGKIEFSSIGSTKMSCSPEVMNIENRMLNIIRNAESFAVNETDLVIIGQDGQRLSFTQN